MTSAHAVREISINLEARPVLSYPMAHNEIPVIARLAIDQVDRDVQGALLRLEVADASGAIGRPQEVLLDLQPDRPTVLTDVTLLLDPAGREMPTVQESILDDRPGCPGEEIGEHRPHLGRGLLP